MLRVGLDSITSDQKTAWRELAAAAVEPNVFFEADYVLAAARALGVEAEISLLVDERDGEWNGCLPVEEKRSLGYPAMMATWKHPYSFLGTPLVRRGRTAAFAKALVGAVEARRANVLLSLLDFGEGPVFEAIRAAQQESGKVRVVRAERAERAAMRPADDEGDGTGMSKKRRKYLTRRRQLLSEELGHPGIAGRTLEVDTGSIEKFLELEAASWKGEAGTAMACDERHAAFFRSVSASLARQGRFWLRSLESDGRVAAMSCEFIAGEVIFGFKSAYDEGLRAFAPGLLLQVDNLVAVKEAARYDLFDSCGDPGNETLNALWPQRRAIWDLTFARRDLRGRLAGGALAARRAVRGLRARRS